MRTWHRRVPSSGSRIPLPHLARTRTLTSFAERHGIRSLDEGAEPEAHTERDDEPELDPALDPELDPEFEPIPAFRSMVPSPSDGNGTSETNGDAQEGDKSLRFRLAQSAARKKGLGDLEPPSS